MITSPNILVKKGKIKSNHPQEYDLRWTENWIYTNFLGVNMVQKSAN